MNLLDWLLVALVLAYALSGYWQGFVTGAFATVGLLLGGLFGVWLAPMALGDADAVAAGLARRAVHRDPVRVARPGAAPVRRRADPRPDHLAADPRARRRRRRGAQRGRRAPRRLGARRRGLRLRASAAITPMVRSSAVLERGRPGAARSRRAASCRRSTTWSAPASSPATSSRSRPSGSSRSARAPAPAAATPTSADAADSVLKIRGTNECGRGVEGTGFLYADEPADDQRPRGRRRGRPGGRARRRARCPAEVVYYNPDLDVAVLGVDTGATRRTWRSTGTAEAQDGGRDPRLPAGRAVRRPARPDPGRAAAALTQHLRRRHGDPRGVLAARAGPARQLRRSDRVLGRRRGRRGVRGVGDRRRHRLRAHRRPGVAERGHRDRPTTPRCPPATAPADVSPVGSGLALERVGDLLALRDRLLGRADLLDLLARR